MKDLVKLHTFLKLVNKKSFAWGEHDCCTFVAAAVSAQTGKDWSTMFDHKSAKEALAYINQYPDLAAFIDQFGYPRVAVGLAQEGDAVVTDKMRTDGTLTAGICVGEKSLFVGKNELIDLPTIGCTVAWRIS